jgi:Dit-like tail protein
VTVYPNVPMVPGVPPLPTPPGFVPPPPPPLLTQDAEGLALPSADEAQWGLYHQNGGPVITADCVVSFEYRQDWMVSDYPLEQGSFESYNRVLVPYDVRVRYASGASDADRAALLQAVDAAANSLEIFDVFTPENLYKSVSIQHYDYRRQARNGVGLLVIDVWCVQVRLLAATSFSQTAAPSGATAVDKGAVQTTAPTQAQAAITTPLPPTSPPEPNPPPAPAPQVGTQPSTESGIPGLWTSPSTALQGLW